MNRPQQLTTSLSTFIAETTWDQLPPAVVHEAKRSLLNFFAVALGGCRDPAVEKALTLFQRFSGASEATIVGRSERLDILHAAALNAISANVFDFDDTHLPTIIHPSAPVAPGLFALAERSPVRGSQLLLAFVIGVDVECRLGNALHPGHYERGWQITSTCGVFGAAAAAAKLLGLDAERTGWALGNASAQSAGLVDTLGSMSKSLSVGNSARNGVVSALLAELGFDGPPEPLDGPRGFLRVTCESPVVEAITDALGTRWEIMANTYKPYPCGIVLNPVIEACLALAPSLAASLNDITQVEITGHPLLRQRTDRPTAASGRQAQVSAQHAVAVTLARGTATLVDFGDDAVRDEGLRAIGAKVRFIDDPSYAVDAVYVTIKLASGRTVVHSVDHAEGSLVRPLSDRALESKLRELIRYGGSGRDPEPLIDAIWSLDTSPDVGQVMRLASR